MKPYRIVLMKPARKFIERQPKARQELILRAIHRLPHEGDVRPMVGHEGVYRLRVGGYRILYSVHDDVLTVEVLTAGNRGDAYK